MPANELTALADRVEALEGPDRAVFEETFAAIYGYKPDRRRLEHIDYKFLRMLDAEAWTSAAEMFAPTTSNCECVFWQVGNDGEGGDPAAFKARVLAINLMASKTGVSVANHPALALLAASLRARAGRV